MTITDRTNTDTVKPRQRSGRSDRRRGQWRGGRRRFAESKRKKTSPTRSGRMLETAVFVLMACFLLFAPWLMHSALPYANARGDEVEVDVGEVETAPPADIMTDVTYYKHPRHADCSISLITDLMRRKGDILDEILDRNAELAELWRDCCMYPSYVVLICILYRGRTDAAGRGRHLLPLLAALFTLGQLPSCAVLTYILCRGRADAAGRGRRLLLLLAALFVLGELICGLSDVKSAQHAFSKNMVAELKRRNITMVPASRGAMCGKSSEITFRDLQDECEGRVHAALENSRAKIERVVNQRSWGVAILYAIADMRLMMD